MTFITDQFQETGNNAGSYFKPLKNQTAKVRILSEKPLEGFVQWTEENKPVRWHWADNKPEANYREGEVGRKFLAVAVYNYSTQSVQVWEITQKSIINQLIEITRDKDFGHPNNYDLKITRKGEGLDTQYNLIPVSAAILPEVEAALASPGCNLEALFTGDNPFA